MNPVIESLKKHRSVRRFRDEPVPDQDVHEAVRAGQAASTSSAVQAYCLLRIRDPETRERLVVLTGNQTKVARAGAFFVVCADSRKHRLLAARSGVPYDVRFEAFLVSVIDAALFAQNAVVAFESMGYGICYVGGLRNALGEVVELLSLPEGVYPLYGLCVGRPAHEPGQRPRLPVEAVLFEERVLSDETWLREIDRYDETYRAYLASRGAEPRGWSDVMTALHAAPRRTDLAEVYRGQGARLD